MLTYGAFSVSLDKIKLTCKVKKSNLKYFRITDNIENLFLFIPPHTNIVIVSENISTRVFGYRYLYCLRLKDDTEGVFTIGIGYNGTWNSKPKPKQFFIEYNPNKSGHIIYKWLCSRLTFEVLEVNKFDIAYDIMHQSIHKLFIDTKCDVMTYGTLSNYTTYIAPKEDKSGRIKIYQKDIERKTQDLKPTVRIECTVKIPYLDFDTVLLSERTFDELNKCVNRLNSVYFRKTCDDDDWQLVSLLNLSTDQLRDVLALMSYNTKSKYKSKIVSNSFNLSLDVSTFVIHCITLIKPYTERIIIR